MSSMSPRARLGLLFLFRNFPRFGLSRDRKTMASAFDVGESYFSLASARAAFASLEASRLRSSSAAFSSARRS